MSGDTQVTHPVLLVDDENDILSLLSVWLKKQGIKVMTATSGEDALNKIGVTKPKLVVTDLLMGGMSGIELMAAIHRDDPLLPVIILSGQAQIPDAVKATHMGSAAFLTKPIIQDEFIKQVKRVLRISPEQEISQFAEGIIYKSREMTRLIDKVQLVADSNVTVFISGATGTGKEVIARAIHKASPRRDAPFIAVNCGAIPEQLLESELFGHEKGAFTGANIRHEGLFQAANSGTLFLDEIGDMPLSLQIKLLRVLQDFEVRPVGSTKSFSIDVRIISATHRDLDSIVEQGEFREDLYYRLKVVPLHMPSLVQRREDIPLLTADFLRGFAEQSGTKLKYFAPDAMDYLISAAWPGNIRQLRNVVDLCATLCKTDTIPLSLTKTALHDQPGEIQTLKDAKQAFEREYLIGALRITDGHVANAAKIAGRNRTEFYKLLNQHDLDPAEFRGKNDEVKL